MLSIANEVDPLIFRCICFVCNTNMYFPCIFTLVWSLFYLFIIHFMHFDLTFGVLEIFLGFSKLMKFLWYFWDVFRLNDLKCSCIASYLHFNNDLHFRCVFTILKWCVLVGLDWVELMMFLLLHVTCSCIFHAYVPFFLSH